MKKMLSLKTALKPVSEESLASHGGGMTIYGCCSPLNNPYQVFMYGSKCGPSYCP